MANKLIFTEPEHLEVFEEVLELVRQRQLSLRKAQAWLEHKTGKKMSYERIRQYAARPADSAPGT